MEEKYDIVIVGGGHNGITAAAYLAKCGLSVCVLEERPEVGGAQENTEPMAGVRIDPHATYLYAGASPGFEQLELHKYGFRMSWNPELGTLRDVETRKRIGATTTDGVVPLTDKDIQGWETLMGLGTQYPFLKDLLRALYWCPPHPPEMQEGPEDVPWLEVIKEKAPEIWSDSLPEMTLFDLMDEFIETEAYKVWQAAVAWYSGAAPHWEGMALQSFAGAASLMIAGASPPRGGMHSYAHAIVRCAIAHGARIRTCC
ncbi:MAG: phytoene desaturase family protein, partial [Dehalococcoidia bacterium]